MTAGPPVVRHTIDPLVGKASPMMNFHCPKCDCELSAEDDQVGALVECPDCDVRFRIKGIARLTSERREKIDPEAGNRPRATARPGRTNTTHQSERLPKRYHQRLAPEDDDASAPRRPPIRPNRRTRTRRSRDLFQFLADQDGYTKSVYLLFACGILGCVGGLVIPHAFVIGIFAGAIAVLVGVLWLTIVIISVGILHFLLTFIIPFYVLIFVFMYNDVAGRPFRLQVYGWVVFIGSLSLFRFVWSD